MIARIRRARVLFAALVLLAACAAGGCNPDRAAPGGPGWRTLEPGLDFATLEGPAGGAIHVLRLDPERFELRLLMASAESGQPRRTVREWCEKAGLVAGINAAMFQEDHLTSVSLMKGKGHVNNPRLTAHRAVLVFDRLDATVPAVQIVDRDAQAYEELAPHYAAHVQSIRMLALDGRNVWEQQDAKYSVATVGVDRAGRPLLILSVAPSSVHDFVETLRTLQIGVRNAMYVEGGPTAQLFVNAGGKRLEATGTYENGFVGDGQTGAAVPVPNVLGVARRKGTP